MSSGEGEQRKTRSPRYFDLTLLGIALLALIPRLLLGMHQYVEYDGYWHVWIAQQDRWANFLREYRANAHPPLYFLLLRLTFWLGKTQLAYRSISLISGTAGVYILGRTAMKAMRSPSWAALAALTYGLALPAILVSNEVRTYMLSAFLVQVSFYYFLDLIGECQPVSAKPRILFAVAAALACLTEYYALFYVAAALPLALALPIARRDRDWPRAWLREAGTFVLILALPVWEYLSHFATLTVTYDHLPGFYFTPDSAEALAGFLMRNLRNELNLFLPRPVAGGTPFYAVAIAMLAAGAIILFLVLRRNKPENRAALASILLPLVMTIAMMAASVVRAYPFGGFLRQQFVLFPFLVVCPFLLPDRLLAGLTGQRWASPAFAGALAIGVAFVSVQNYQAWPKIGDLLLTGQMERYNRLFPVPEAVYTDQFNLITFFTHHHDWDWKFIGSVPGTAAVDIYKLASGNRALVLLRDKSRWNLDFREPELYASFARAMQADHLSKLTVFCVTQLHPLGRTEGQVAAYRTRVADLSAAHGLCVQTLDLENFDVFAEFRTNGTCTGYPDAN